MTESTNPSSDWEKIYQKLGFTISSALIVLVVGFLLIQLGEKIAVGNGAGFDGICYVYQVQNFEQLIETKKINSTSEACQIAKVDRFLASMIVYYGMKFLSIPVSDYAAVVRGFEYNNLFWLVMAAIAWGTIGKRLHLQEKSKWLGFAFFFCSLAVMKLYFYNPVITDATAVCLGLILMAFFVQDSWLGLAGMTVVGIAGGFVWQPIMIYAYLLFLFPRNTVVLSEPNKWLNWIVGGIPVFLFVLYFIIDYRDGMKPTDGIEVRFGQTPMIEKMLWLSVILAVIYTLFYFFRLGANASWKNLWYFVKPQIDDSDIKNIVLYNVKRFVPLAIVFFTVKYFHESVSAEGVAEQGAAYISSIATTAVTNPFMGLMGYIYSSLSLHAPLEFLVFGGVYFGPAVVIAAFFYSSVSEQIRKEGGIGIILIFIASFSGLLNPQTRIMGTAFFPVLLLFVVLMIDRQKWQTKYYYVLAAAALLASKVWLPIGNVWQLPNGSFGPAWDRLFMNYGTWATPKSYFIHAFIFLGLGIYFLLNRKQLSENALRFETSKAHSETTERKEVIKKDKHKKK
jgi:hypothetical protein